MSNYYFGGIDDNPVKSARLIPPPIFHYSNPSEKLIKQYRDTLLKYYHEYDNELIVDFRKSGVDNLQLKKHISEKTCFICGAKMRLIRSRNFWSCPNYNDGRAHPIFNKEYEPKFPGVTVSKNWLTTIIYQAGLQKRLKAKSLLGFYESEGLEDLREKYGFTSTYKTVNNFIETRKRSQEQELVGLKALQSMYSKVSYQQWIEYSLSYSHEIKICCPDFICGSSNEVVVYDAKLSAFNDDIIKITLYKNIVKRLLESVNDSRPVKCGLAIFVDDMFEVNDLGDIKILRI